MTDSESPDNDIPDSPSKSQRKREMHALQELGEALAALNDGQFAALDLPDSVREAIEQYKAIRQREAKRRQMQYIGKLMRKVDGEHIAEQLEALKAKSTLSTQRQHQIEAWREQMLHEAESQQAVQAFIERFPEVDIQHLRQLVRQAAKERAQQKTPVQARKLFRYLRDTMAGHD